MQHRRLASVRFSQGSAPASGAQRHFHGYEENQEHLTACANGTPSPLEKLIMEVPVRPLFFLFAPRE